MTRHAVVLLVGLLLSMIATAQTVIRTTTRLVQLNVIVEDRKGNPVGDLAKEDFVVVEDGRRQNIAVFSVEKGEELATSANPLPAGFFSNRLEYQGGVPNSVTVLLFDLLNTPPGYFGRAAPNIARFLQRVDPRFRIAIYSLGSSGVRVLHDFTTDTAALTRKLGDIRDPKRIEIPLELSQEVVEFLTRPGDPSKASSVLAGGGSGMDLVAAVIAAGARREQEFYQGQRSAHTADVLAAIARRLAAVPGRKNLVWISTGFSSDPRKALPGFLGGYERAIRALSDASVTVYPVDARGLLAYGDSVRFTPGPPRGRGGGQVAFEPSITDERNTLQQVANRTGGKLFFGTEVDQALPQVFAHSRVSYALGYYPSNLKYDGKFRQVQVKVTRKDVRLSHRPGYYAVADPGPASEEAKAELAGAVWSPIDATAVGLNAYLEQSGAGTAERTLVTHVAGDSVLFEPREGDFLCRMELFVVQKDAAGKQVEGTLDRFEVAAPQAQLAALRASGVAHRKNLQLRPETAIVRLVVRTSAGAMGSLSIPLEKR